MKNMLKAIAKFFRKLNYIDVGPFRDGKALALIFVMWSYYDPAKNIAVVIIDEDYNILEWTNYRTIKEAKEALYGDN